MADPSFGSGLTDFSVDAQRRLFVEQQERERRAAENRKASRTAKRLSAAAAAAGEGGGAVALSGLVSRMEQEAKDGGGPRRVRVGDDDDDSIADDDWSLDSEESFYVGIERADYAQPDSLAMYGEDVGDDVVKEDRFGIGRVSAALLSVEGGKGGRASSDWDADVVPVHDERSGSSLHAFMNGSNGGTTRASRGTNNDLVARPVVGRGLGWTAEGTLPTDGDDDASADDQVYEHAAAEGKAFIDKIANGPPGADALDASEKRGQGNLPVLSPLAVFAPGLSSSSGAGGGGEDNAARQMREREIRGEEQMAAERRVADFERMVASRKDAGGKVDADEVVGLLEGLMKGRKQKAWC